MVDKRERNDDYTFYKLKRKTETTRASNNGSARTEAHCEISREAEACKYIEIMP